MGDNGAAYAAELSDQLDAPDFDAVAFINKKFPTEASLSQLDTFIVGIGSQISVLDDEISRAVQAQSSANRQASTEIADAQARITELFNKINDIKSKAAQSERMVHDICADIKKLDFAKTHLQASITSLKRLQMLSTAVGQLEVPILSSLVLSLFRSCSPSSLSFSDLPSSSLRILISLVFLTPHLTCHIHPAQPTFHTHINKHTTPPYSCWPTSTNTARQQTS